MTTTLPLIELGADYLYDPHPVYDRLRPLGPIHHVKLPNGLTAWLVVDHRLAREVLTDERIKKNATARAAITARQLGDTHAYSQVNADLTEHLLNIDPPQHTRLRRLVSKAFTARTVALLHPRIELLADALLDRMVRLPEVDLIADYALPIPITVICEMFGVPEADRARFQQLSTTMLASSTEHAPDPEVAARSPFYATVAERGAASVELASYLIGLITERSRALGEDILSELIRANHEDDKLTERELISMLFLILVAGHETTVNLIGNGLLAVLSDRSLYDELADDPDRIPAAVEEFLRWEGPVHLATQRYTSEPVTLAGVDIPADELVYVSLAAADHDPTQFADPHRIRIGGEKSKGHLAFGHGIHYCLGAPLARLEGRVAFEKILGRYRNMTISNEVCWRPSTFMRGLEALPVTLNQL
ncbi:cytochrome P450 [Nocardia sp. CDC159]|uniref:Cytochrome P450 n=1 Tax=Nocardia pulmonis TaxID=2951408 RepID=A0A9X2IVU1_9NOCA|nr:MULTISPECIES: cytochrome P450 [Nocardia]MCM6773588.1 cytochrome P450 [Nocardia pulmonis]MCM6786475.1 cytochrome P450 [Nocardia sp. CDC159]